MSLDYSVKKAAHMSCFFIWGQNQIINDETQDFRLLSHPF